MQLSLSFIRVLFFGLCILFATIFSLTKISSEDALTRLFIGAILGTIFGSVVVSMDILFKRLNLRTFVVTTLGLFFGYLLGSAFLLIFQTFLEIIPLKIESAILLAIQTCVFLFSCYFGMMIAARASQEFYIEVPFVSFKAKEQAKKNILIDSSALLDPRTLDLASSGLLDQNLVVPRFLLKELHQCAESPDEAVRSKAKRSLDAYKKLESMTSLELRYSEINIPELPDTTAKFACLARQLNAYILTADPYRNQPLVEGIRLINLNVLSNAMKQLTLNGESLNIKIQRYGKEPRQGVGYLDDGTMVVVNGGADYIGATIRALVLSVKHTTSGRMIFCNAADSEGFDEPTLTGIHTESGNSASSYLAV